MTVHILSTVRKKELLPAALLVFKTLRVGFPTARVVVYPNDLVCDPECVQAIIDAARGAGCEVTGHENYMWEHPEWIRHVITENTGWNVICDTDMVFHEKVEDWEFQHTPMAGWYVPQFLCPYTKATTCSRIHTSLMWLNCDWLQSVLKREPEIYMANQDLISPCTFWLGGKKFFHDTMGQLFHCEGVSGLGFNSRKLDCYTHLFSGTLIDLVGKDIPGLAMAHAEALAHPEATRGVWRAQQAWYEGRRV